MFRKPTCSRTSALEPLEPRCLFAAGPLVITHGGTYTGSYTSTDPNTPVISIRTTEPVIIDGATLTGRGDLIQTAVSGTDITVRNTSGYGTNPNVAGLTKGRFLDADQFVNADIENNYLEGTAGISLLDYAGNGSANQTIRVIGNRARNIDGRLSNGNGGYLDFNVRKSIADGHTEKGYTEVQFVQLNQDVNVPNVEIAWNEVINEPGNSRVEDNISIYKSSGTSASPILIHDNYIQGAYTIEPWQGNTSDANWTYDWSYSGGGIMLGDGLGVNGAAGDPAYVKAYGNQVVSTTNYGIAISAGHDLQFYDNRIVSADILPDGRTISAQNTGAYVWDSHNVGSSRFYNNSARNNTVGWNVANGLRNDWWILNAALDLSNIHWSGTITAATEKAEYNLWLDKMYAQYPSRKPSKPNPPTLSIAGTIYCDGDGDGIRTSSEWGMSGFRVFLDTNNNHRLDKGETWVRSSSSGRYKFYDLPAGNYTICVTPVERWRPTQGLIAHVTATSTKTTTRYFGFTRLALVTGTVFMDANKNGDFNGLEDPLPGWQVFDDANQDGILDAGEASATTRSNGTYTLLLAGGMHHLRVVASPNYRQTTPTSLTLAIYPAVVLRNNNFGEKRLHN